MKKSKKILFFFEKCELYTIYIVTNNTKGLVKLVKHAEPEFRNTELSSSKVLVVVFIYSWMLDKGMKKNFKKINFFYEQDFTFSLSRKTKIFA